MGGERGGTGRGAKSGRGRGRPDGQRRGRAGGTIGRRGGGLHGVERDEKTAERKQRRGDGRTGPHVLPRDARLRQKLVDDRRKYVFVI